MKKNNPARRAGEKNNLAPILSKKMSRPGPKFQAPPPLNIKWTVPNKASLDEMDLHTVSSKTRSTEGCSNLKSPETRQVQEILVSTLEHLQVPKWDRTRTRTNVFIEIQ